MSEPPQPPSQPPPQGPDQPGDPRWQHGPQWSQPPAGQQPPSQPPPQGRPYPGQQQPGYPPYGYPAGQGDPGQPPPYDYPSGQPWAGGYAQGPQGPYGPGGPNDMLHQQRPLGAVLAERVGVRLRVRPEPRFSVSLAAAGMALTIVGALVWTIGYVADGLHVRLTSSGLTADGEGRRFLGFVLALLVAVVGYLVLIRIKRGPLATAGAIAAALGIPAALAFLTFDIGGVTQGDFPINLDVVYLVSIVIWLLTYFLVPGARGRAFFLGLALISLPSYIEYKMAASSLLRTAEVGTLGGGGFNSSGLSTGGITAVGLIFGLAYYAAAFLLDRRGSRGVAVAFVVAAFFTTAEGIIASVNSFKQVGTGLELVILGAVLSWYGARAGRRFTSWVWAALIPVGIVVLVAKVSPDNATAAGISMLIIGLVVIAVAAVVSSATREPTDIDDPAAGAPAPLAGGFGGQSGYGHPGAHV